MEKVQIILQIKNIILIESFKYLDENSWVTG